MPDLRGRRVAQSREFLVKLAYADPPYYGYGKWYDEHHVDSREYDGLEAHKRLIDRLCSEFSDGWALSMTSGNLHDILPLCPPEARVAAWVKPFAVFKRAVSPAYTWEPVVFVRTRPHPLDEETARDHLAANPHLSRELRGAKPEAVCSWILDLLGWRPGDELVDLFPGTGVMGRVVAARSGIAGPGELDLFGVPASHMGTLEAAHGD